MPLSDGPFKLVARSTDGETSATRGRFPTMPAETDGPLRMREAECPFCERMVLVYEEPPRCPLCACPLDEERMRDHLWPGEEPGPVAP
jgi:hypothetical protein